MAATETYKGLTVLDSASGAGGSAIDTSLRNIADWLSNASVFIRSDYGTIVNYHPTADTDAARGTAFLSAVSAAVAGDTIYLSGGTFDTAASRIQPAAYVAMRGAGVGITVVSSTKTAGTVESLIVPAAGLQVSDLTILDQNVAQGTLYLVGYGSGDTAPSNSRATPIRFDNVRMEGYQDCVILNQGSGSAHMQFHNCTFYGGYDCCNVVFNAANVVEFYGCDLDSDEDRTTGQTAVSRPINCQSASSVIRLYNCRLASDGGVTCYGIQCSGGTIEMHGGSIVTSGGSSVTYDVLQSGDGAVTFSGVSYDQTKIFGTVANWSTEVPVFIRNESGAITPYHLTADTDAARGVAFLAAVGDAVAGDTVHLSSGTFAVGNNQIVQAAGVTVAGAGEIATVLDTDYVDAATGETVPWNLNGGTITIRDLTLSQDPTVGGTYGTGWGTTEAAPSNDIETPIIFRNVRFTGGVDAIMLSQASGTAYIESHGCTFYNGYDVITIQTASNTVEFYDCLMDTDSTRRSGAEARAIYCIAASTVRMFGSRLSAIGDGGATAAIYNTGGTVTAVGCTISSSGGVGVDHDVFSPTGTVVLTGCSYDSTRLSGNVTENFVRAAGNQTVAGVKTFSGLPVFSAGTSVPAADVQTLATDGQIAPSAGIVEVAGSGGAVALTSNPQITAGVDGQVLIVTGSSDTNTLEIVDGNGVHVHDNAVLGDHDYLTLVYHDDDSQWEETARNFSAHDVSWSFMSRDAATGTNYVGGFYKFAASDDNFNPAVNFGTANASYAAHAFVVAAAGGSGGTDTVVRVTGTSITDAGVRTTSDTEDLTLADDGAAGTYYETAKKWLGQVSFEKQSGPDLLCNYGFCKYWDNNNANFQIFGFEATWLGAQNDNTPDILLRHHKATGWTYNSGAAPTPPAAIASMNTDHDTEILVRANEEGAWKRDNLTQSVAGGDSEGTIVELQTTAARAYAIGNFLMRVRNR